MLASAVAVGGSAAMAGAQPSTDSISGVEPTEAESVSPGDDGADSLSGDGSVDHTDVEIDEQVKSAEGTTRMVVRLDEATRPNTADTEATVNVLRGHAATTQHDVVSFAESTTGVEVHNTFWVVNAVVLEVDTDKVDLDSIAERDHVDRIHPDFELQVPEPADTNDAPDTSEFDDSTYGLDQINATETWEAFGAQGAGVDVAVLDTGVDPDHDDIDIDPENFAEFDADGEVINSDPYDTSDHGTHVSGTVVGGDASGTHIGVAPEATLYHGLVLPGGSGSFAQITGGIEWAVEEDADVVSMSLGATGYFDEMIEPVRNAEAAGTLVVASSGNDGEGTSGSPGNVYESYAVGASNEAYSIAPFSSGETIETDAAWGDEAPADWPDEYVVPDVAAPGVEVFSSISGNGYAEFSGTSMAAPHVTGTAALMIDASDGDAGPAGIKSALEETAFKPESEPDEQDDRYGHGIVDAYQATELVALDSGIEGTITDTDEESVDATVSHDGGFVTTTENGEYSLIAQPGDREVTVEAFGFESDVSVVTVQEDEFTEHDVTLDDAVDAMVGTDLPEFVESGSSVEGTIDAANVDTFVASLEGEIDADHVDLYVDGDYVEWGESVTFDDPRSGTIPVTVETDDGVVGSFAVDATLSGLGDEVGVFMGPTTVYDEEIDVAVVTSTPGTDFFGEDTVDDIEGISPQFDAELLYRDDVRNLIENDDVESHDVYVVHRFFTDVDPAFVEEFAEATESNDVGTVYLDQWGLFNSDSIKLLSQATGDPASVSDGGGFLEDFGPTFEPTQPDHPIFDDVAEEGESVLIHEAAAGDISFFDGYTGATLANASGSTDGQPTEGPAIAVDDGTQTVLAASLGRTTFVESGAFTEDANRILGNAIRFSDADSPIEQVSGQPERVSPGESIEVTYSVEEIREYELTLLDERSTLEEGDLTVRVNGNVADFDQALAYDDLTDEEFTIEVESDADVAGSVVLNHRFQVERDDVFDPADDNYFSGTGPTAVYDPPLSVPDDVESINEAAEVIESGGTIAIGDGTYEEQVYVPEGGKRNLTITAADGASPTIEIPDDADPGEVPTENPVGLVSTSGALTIEDIEVNATDQGAGIFVDGDVTMTNVTVRNAGESFPGIQIGVGGLFSLTEADADIENVTVESSGAGIVVEGAPGTEISDVGIEDVGVGVLTESQVAVTETTIEDADEAAIVASQQQESVSSLIENVHVENVGDGVYEDTGAEGFDVRNSTFVDVEGSAMVLGGSAEERAIEHNHVENASVGVDVDQFGEVDRIEHNEFHDVTAGVDFLFNWRSGTEVTRNAFSGEMGVVVGAPDDGYFPEVDNLEVSYNDLADTETGIINAVERLDSDINPSVVDARLNYFGPDGPAADDARTVTDIDGPLIPRNIVQYEVEAEDGGVVVDPYLVSHPDHEDVTHVPSEETEVGLSVSFGAGEVYRFGVPGAVNGTVEDVFDADFEGAIYGYDAHEDEWTLRSGNDTIEPLEGLVVVAESDGTAALEFTADEPGSPSSAGVVEGWNYLAPPHYGPIDESVGLSSADVSVAMGLNEAPNGQVGPAGELDGTHVFGDGETPSGSPLEGYFLFADEDGTVPATLPTNPTAPGLYDGLGLEWEIDALGTIPTDPVTDSGSETEATMSPATSGVGPVADDEGVEAATEPVEAVHSVAEIEHTIRDKLAPLSDDERATVESAVRQAVTELVVDVRAEEGTLTVAELEATIESVIDETEPSVSSHGGIGTATETVVA